MNPKLPFYPIAEDIGTNYMGISIRDYIAIEAMKGMLSNEDYVRSLQGTLAKSISHDAYLYADALIAESNK